VTLHARTTRTGEQRLPASAAAPTPHARRLVALCCAVVTGCNAASSGRQSAAADAREQERIEAAQWTELSRAAVDTQPDFGIGVAYFEPGVDGTPPVNDTVTLRAAPASDARQVARFIFSMPSGNGWSYAVLAPDAGASSNLLEFGYEEAGLPIDSILPDSSWARLLYGVDPRGVVQRGWASLQDGKLDHVLWSQWLPERAWFFLRDDYVRFFAQPGGAPVQFPLAPAQATGRSRFDYHLEPDTVVDGWLRVRVITPSNACGMEAAGVQDTTVWVRYLGEDGRPLVWYYTRGC
jgi:hypothetical protein